MVVSLTHPHDPFNIQQPYWDRYRDDEIDMPRWPEAALDPHSRRLRHVINLDRQPVTPAQMRAARHAYYGAISFVDDQIGAVLGALTDARLAEDTIIVLLADHGEMLGEHGLWYKMSWFEGACRIPLMVHAPGYFVPGTVAQSVSLLDILPTLAELGGDGAAPDYVTPLDGHSLLPHLQRTGGHDAVIGEYLAEGAIAPLVMLRRGRWKFIHSPADPDQLYDLAADPGEQVNLAESAAETAAFRALVAENWSLPALTAAVLASQRRRRFVAAALDQGKRTAWDYQPVSDASQQYMRNHMQLDDLEARARFPRFSADPA
jgi:choline-sulfatase